MLSKSFFCCRKIHNETDVNGLRIDMKNRSSLEKHKQELFKGKETIYVGFIMRHVDSASSGKFKKQFVIFIRSIFKNLKCLDRDIHFIVLTDHKSSYHVVKLLNKFVKKDVYDRLKVISYNPY